jgi:hypothetical protein
MESFLESYGGLLTLAALFIAAAAIVLALIAVIELVRLKRPFRSMAGVCEKKGAELALEELLKGIDENREFLRAHSDEIGRILQMLAACYTGTGLVKYNAFEDIGGMQSYSLCLLTREKHGFILTNLVGRTSTRGYALDIRDGKPSRNLSDEEKESFDAALRSLAPHPLS